MLSKCSTTELCPFKKVAYYIMNICRCLKMYIKLVKSKPRIIVYTNLEAKRSMHHSK